MSVDMQESDSVHMQRTEHQALQRYAPHAAWNDITYNITADEMHLLFSVVTANGKHCQAKRKKSEVKSQGAKTGATVYSLAHSSYRLVSQSKIVDNKTSVFTVPLMSMSIPPFIFKIWEKSVRPIICLSGQSLVSVHLVDVEILQWIK